MLRKFYTSKKKDRGEIHAIVANLNYILNTRKYFGSFLRTMGIGDYNVYRSRAMIVETIIDEIKENIALFETRVKLEDISEVESDSPFRLRFQVRCVFVEGSRPIYIVVDSRANRVTVEDH